MVRMVGYGSVEAKATKVHAPQTEKLTLLMQTVPFIRNKIKEAKIGVTIRQQLAGLRYYSSL